jgi:uncharacterized coiled-coil protein SlyX
MSPYYETRSRNSTSSRPASPGTYCSFNEFLKEHRELAELKSTVAEQRKGVEAMAAQLKAQGALIQKVSAQLELSKPAPQMVNNPQAAGRPNKTAAFRN